MSDTHETIVAIIEDAEPVDVARLEAEQSAEELKAKNADKSKASRSATSKLAGEPADDGGNKFPIDTQTVESCAREPQNDTGNARRLLAHFGNKLLHVREVGWHYRKRTHWEREGGDEAVVRDAQMTAERIHMELCHVGQATLAEQEAIDAGDEALKTKKADRTAEQNAAVLLRAEVLNRIEKHKSGRARHANSSGNHPRINAMIAQAIPLHTVAPAQLDADPLAFNVMNGTLRFVPGEVDPECPDPDVERRKWSVRLDEHRPSDLITKQAPVTYDPNAKCPEWEKSLRYFQPNEATRIFLRDYHGYALTALTGNQTFVFNWGAGANFKSSFIEAICRLMGDYAQTLNPESFTGHGQRRGDQATPDFAQLPGARLLRVSELPAGAQLNEALVKALTGGEPMKVRHLNKGFFDFRPVFKASMSGNAMPEIYDVSHGMWRRVLLVPWNVVIGEDQRRDFEDMQDVFKAERSGILNWLIAGALAYLTAGRLDPPEEVRAATAAHRAEMDPIEQFTQACIESASGAQVQAREMYEAYCAWCSSAAVRAFKEKTFAKVMKQKGFRKESGRLIQYLDVRLHDVPTRERDQRVPANGAVPSSAEDYPRSKPSHFRGLASEDRED